MPDPIAFMVMPFNRQPTGQKEKKVPSEVDFDALWERVYEPILKELGYRPVRADRDVGALIINQMIQRLAVADVVVVVPPGVSVSVTEVWPPPGRTISAQTVPRLSTGTVRQVQSRDQPRAPLQCAESRRYSRSAAVARIFISHSSNHDHFAAQVRDAVERELFGLGHQPLIDGTLIDPGDRWRAKLLRWLGSCHGAVLLLTSRAADRDWVRAEATIIGWRAWLNPTMRVVPVLLDEGASSSSLDELGLAPVRLRDIEVLKAKDLPGDDAGAWGKAIAQCFAGYSTGPVRDDPMALWVKRVGTHLERNGFLEEAAEALGIPDADRIDIEGSLYELVAHRLLHSDVAQIEAAVLQLANDARLEPEIGAFAPLVSCAWLPADMAALLFRVAAGEASPQVAAVCVAIQTTAGRLLKRLTCCDNRYVVIDPISLDGTGADDGEELLGRYEQAILSAAGTNSLRHFETAMRSRDAARPNRPIFVVLGEDALSAGVLNDLAPRFAGVVFLCAADADTLESSVLGDAASPRAVELTPRLVEGDEIAGSSMADRLEHAS